MGIKVQLYTATSIPTTADKKFYDTVVSADTKTD